MSINWSAFRYPGGIFREFGIIITCLVCIAGLWLFIEITEQVTDHQTQSFDDYVLTSFRESSDLSDPIGPEWGEEVARDITSLGSKTLLVLIVLSVAGFLFLKGHPGQGWLILGVSLAGLLLTLGLKSLFMRARPDVVPHLGSAVTQSYPSGHTMMSAVIYLSLAAMLSYIQTSRRVKLFIITVGMLITFLVGVSRVYLGVHYPTDVLAGWAIGLAWAAFCWIIFRYFNHRYINRQKL